VSKYDSDTGLLTRAHLSCSIELQLFLLYKLWFVAEYFVTVQNKAKGK
jgi:hypothetical protein